MDKGAHPKEACVVPFSIFVRSWFFLSGRPRRSLWDGIFQAHCYDADDGEITLHVLAIFGKSICPANEHEQRQPEKANNQTVLPRVVFVQFHRSLSVSGPLRLTAVSR